MKHASRPKIVTRLKRAQGHLASVLTMFGDNRSCMDLAQQLHAVENAIGNAKRELIHDHIEHCFDVAGETANLRAALKEIKQLAKYI